MNFNDNVSILKKALRFFGLVALFAISILFFLVLLLRYDLVEEAFTSTPVVGVACIVVGGAIGFIAGAIAIYLNTVKAVEKREESNRKLQRKLEQLEEDYNEACKTLAQILPHHIEKEKKEAVASNQRKVSALFGEIADLSPDETTIQDEDVSES